MAVMNLTQTQFCIRSFPIETSILLVGNHGIGKSQSVIQVANEQSMPCIDFRLSQVEAADLIGMPFHVQGRTYNAPPQWWPLCEADAVQLKEFLGLTKDIAKGQYGDKGILFLDELNRATRDVQQAVFELIHDRRMHGRSLPPGWRVVSAINGDSDIYTTTKMEPALLSRFFLIDFEPTVEEWLAWADRDSNVHPVITEFIRKNNELLDPTKEQLEAASLKGLEKVHDRRAWHKFSQVITKMAHDFDEGLLPKNPLAKEPDAINWMFQLAGGFVGPIAQAAFKNFLETDYQALDANIIVNHMTDAIKEKLEIIVEAGRIPELAAYNELILDYFKKNIKDELSAAQSRNIAVYVSVLPNELRGDIWQKWNKEQKEISQKWYRLKSVNGEPNSKLVLGALLNPEALKKHATADAK